MALHNVITLIKSVKKIKISTIIIYSQKNFCVDYLISKAKLEKLETSKVRDKNNKTMTFHINDKNLLEKYKTIYTKVEGLILN